MVRIVGLGGDVAALAVETRELTKTFGSVVAVDDLSLSVPKGSVFGLLGPNGAGKTTLIGLLLGLIAPTSGDFTVLGGPVDADAPRLAGRVGAAMETPSFYPHLSGRENLRFFQGIGGGGGGVEVDRLLELVGLTDRADSRVGGYSLGMKHRLGVAYALLHDPELLLLDEPTNGLDPAGMAEVRGLVGDLADGERTIVLASHLLGEVQQVCDHVAILSKGKLVVQGEVAGLLEAVSGVAVRSTDDGRAMEILRDLDFVEMVSSTPDGLEVAAPYERSWELSAALAAEGVHIVEMIRRERSLEDYFMEVTGSGEDGP